MKILIWGAGSNGNLYRRYIEEFTEDEFVGFVDNNSHGGRNALLKYNSLILIYW